MRNAGLVGLLTLAVFAASACSAGPKVPPVEDIAEACIPDFCVEYPVGWEVVERGAQFVSFAYPGFTGVVATVGRVNLEGVARNAGGSWPLPASDVVDLFWDLLDNGSAELARVDLVEGGAFDSWGFIGSGRLWHRLIPISASRGYGIEVRAPDASWEEHADVFRSRFVAINTDL